MAERGSSHSSASSHEFQMGFAPLFPQPAQTAPGENDYTNPLGDASTDSGSEGGWHRVVNSKRRMSVAAAFSMFPDHDTAEVAAQLADTEPLDALRRLVSAPYTTYLSTDRDKMKIEMLIDYIPEFVDYFSFSLKQKPGENVQGLRVKIVYAFLTESFNVLSTLSMSCLTVAHEDGNTPIDHDDVVTVAFNSLQKGAKLWKSHRILPSIGSVDDVKEVAAALEPLGEILLEHILDFHPTRSMRFRHNLASSKGRSAVSFTVTLASVAVLALTVASLATSLHEEWWLRIMNVVASGVMVVTSFVFVFVLQSQSSEDASSAQMAAQSNSMAIACEALEMALGAPLASPGYSSEKSNTAKSPIMKSAAQRLMAASTSANQHPSFNYSATQPGVERERITSNTNTLTSGGGVSYEGSAHSQNFIESRHMSMSSSASNASPSGSAAHTSPFQILLGEHASGRSFGIKAKVVNDFMVVVGWDAAQNVIFWNSAATAMTGYQPDETRGKPVARFADIEDPLTTRTVAMFRMNSKSGRPIVCRGSIVSIFLDNGRQVGTIAIAPFVESLAMKTLHGYQTERMLRVLQLLSSADADLDLTNSCRSQLRSLLSLHDWDTIHAVSENTSNRWAATTREALLEEMNQFASQVEVTESVPESFILDMEGLRVVVESITNSRKGSKLLISGQEFGEQYLAFCLHFTPTGGGYPFNLDTVEDCVGVDLVNLGGHLYSDPKDQSTLCLEFPGIVNLPSTAKVPRNVRPVIAIWGVDSVMARGFTTELYQLEAASDFTVRYFRSATPLELVLAGADCLLTGIASLDALRRWVNAPTHPSTGSGRSSVALSQQDLPLVLVLSSEGAPTTSTDSKRREHRLQFPFTRHRIVEVIRLAADEASTRTRPSRLWDQGQLLGRGAQGAVYEAHLNPTFLDVAKGVPATSAVKIISKQTCDPVATWKEIGMLSTLEHPHVIPLYFAEESSSTFSLLLELCPKSLNEETVAATGDLPRIMRQLVEAVAFLHENDVVHRDIKPSNVLLNANGVVKLSDFGVSSPNLDAALQEMAGTYRFMAPEVFRGSPAGPPSDIWSIGCVLCHVLDAPPTHMGKKQQLRLMNMTRVDLPRKIVDPSIRELLTYCFAVNPAQRFTALQLLSLNYLSPSRASVVSYEEVPTEQNAGAGPITVDGVANPLAPVRRRSAMATGSANERNPNLQSLFDVHLDVGEGSGAAGSLVSTASGFTLSSNNSKASSSGGVPTPSEANSAGT